MSFTFNFSGDDIQDEPNDASPNATASALQAPQDVQEAASIRPQVHKLEDLVGKALLLVDGISCHFNFAFRQVFLQDSLPEVSSNILFEVHSVPSVGTLLHTKLAACRIGLTI
jgi:hypothetical protein